MKEEEGETEPPSGKEVQKMENSGQPMALTPPPSAPHPPYVFPILNVKSVTVWGPNAQTGLVDGGFVEFTMGNPPTLQNRETLQGVTGEKSTAGPSGEGTATT